MQSSQSQIELCRREYKRQKILEQIVQKRPQNRPSTEKWQVTLLLLFIPPFIFLEIYLYVILPITIVHRLLIFLFLIFLTVELYIRFCLIQAVKCYQHYAKNETRRRCLCIPSCSEYAILSLKRVFPLIIALLKIRKRLYVTCKGEEYRVDFPFEKMNASFEKEYVDIHI